MFKNMRKRATNYAFAKGQRTFSSLTGKFSNSISVANFNTISNEIKTAVSGKQVCCFLIQSKKRSVFFFPSDFMYNGSSRVFCLGKEERRGPVRFNQTARGQVEGGLCCSQKVFRRGSLFIKLFLLRLLLDDVGLHSPHRGASR